MAPIPILYHLVALLSVVLVSASSAKPEDVCETQPGIPGSIQSASLIQRMKSPPVRSVLQVARHYDSPADVSKTLSVESLDHSTIACPGVCIGGTWIRTVMATSLRDCQEHARGAPSEEVTYFAYASDNGECALYKGSCTSADSRLRFNTYKLKLVLIGITEGMASKPGALNTLSFLHEIVGRDGVLQISLARAPQRASYASAQLQAVGVFPTTFPATDSMSTPEHILHEGCDQNCAPEEAAIAVSHKRALEAAALRSETWTAILEDDAVPVLMNGMTGSVWNEELRNIWQQLPTTARIVRLNWCWPGSWSVQWMLPAIGQGRMRLTQFGMQYPQQNIVHNVGLCTAAYMVHKDIIPRLLSIFPCNCAVDSCMGWKFFNSWNETAGVPMLSYLYNLDMVDSTAFIHETSDEGRNSSGVMMQAYKQLQQLGQLGSTVLRRAGAGG